MAKPFLSFGHCCRLVVKGVGTCALIEVLRATGCVAASVFFHPVDELIDFGRSVFRERHAEGFGEDLQDVVGRSVGVLDGLLAALSRAECLAVLIHVEVLFEQQRAECRRRSDEDGIVWSLFFCQIVIGLSVGDDGREQKCDDAGCLFHCFVLLDEFRDCKDTNENPKYKIHEFKISFR